MSLTQERIYTIATEVASNTVVSEALFDKELFDFVDLFLSRIREEQEPFGYVLDDDIDYLVNEPDDRTIPIYQEKGDRPLFTIPPAASYNCLELVEALKYLREHLIGELGYKIDEALANHAKRMKGE